MKNIRKFAANPWSILFLCLSFLFASCGGEDVVNIANDSVNIENSIMALNAPNYKSEELFESVIFADGPLTDQIYGLRDKTPEKLELAGVKLKEFRKLKADLIVDINNANPAFFAHFKTEITSGEPTRIRAIIIESQDKVYKALETRLDRSDIAIDDLVSEYNTQNDNYPELEDINNSPQGVALIILITIVIVIGIAINVTVTKTKVDDVLAESGLTARTNLNQEMMISDIATKFKD
jgi:SdpC family antimicrobial peptide